MEFKQFKTIVFLAFVLLFANKVFSIEKRNLIVDDGEVGFKLIPSSISRTIKIGWSQITAKSALLAITVQRSVAKRKSKTLCY